MATSSRTCVAALLVFGLGCNSDTPLDPLEDLAFRRANPPSEMIAFAAAYNRIDGSWNDNSPNESGFELWRALGVNGTFALLMRVGANVTGFSDASVDDQTEYCYEARAYRVTGNTTTYSDFSNISCATTPPTPVPAAPSGTSVAPQSSDAVTITWNDNATNETGFRVEFSLGASEAWTQAILLQSNVTSFTHYNRTAEQVVCYRVSASNDFGSSVPSNVDCTAPPLGPDQLSATGVGSAISLSWTDNSGVEDGYVVQRSGPDGEETLLATLPPNTASYLDATASPDTRYSYGVAAAKDGGHSSFATVSGLAASAPPVAPVITNVFPQSSSSIAIYWTEASVNIDGFRVEFSPDNGVSWSSAGTTPWNQNAFGHGQLASEQPLCYRVIALNSAGASAPSNEGCTTPPAAPSGLTATPTPGFAITLTWTDNSNVEDGYDVLQLINNCGGYYYYYYYYCYPYYATVASVGANATSHEIAGLNYWEFYTFVVVARKDGGSSDHSNQVGSYPGPAVP